MGSRQYTHELENDRMSTDQCDFMDYIDEELAAILGEDFQGSLSPAGSDSSSSSTLINNPQSSSTAAAEPPRNPNKSSNFSAANGGAAANNLDKAFSSPALLNSQNAKSSENSQQGRPWINNPDEETVISDVHRNEVLTGPKRVCTENKSKRPRPPSQTYDHIMAERKRREQLSQRFVALSAIIPGLKKMDKTSVLGDTIKYLKHLQERVKMLEEQAAKQTVESVVLVKKSQIVEDEGSSDEKNTWACENVNSSLPEIEARVCDKTILFKIHCEKRRGVLVKILAQIDKFNLTVVSTNVTPFGSVALDITITAEMDKEIGVSAKDMVKTLRSALQQAAR